MSTETRFLVVRHAKPSGSQEDMDPGIDAANQQQDIDDAALTISTILEATSSNSLAVFSSPKRRAVETAVALACSSHLSGLFDGTFASRSDLDESIFRGSTLDQVQAKWDTILPSIAAMALANSAENVMPTILLVTHEPVIGTIPYIAQPNIKHLGINEFTISVD